MFGLASGYYENYLKPPDVRILLVGLDGAGKTALLERLKVTDFKNRRRTSSGRRLTLDTNTDFQKRTPAPQDDNDDDDDDDDSQSKLEMSSLIESRSSADVDLNNVNTSNDHGHEHAHRQIRRTSMCPTNSIYRERQIEGDNDEEYAVGFPSESAVGINNSHKDSNTTKAVHRNSNRDDSHNELAPDPSDLKEQSSDRMPVDDGDEELGGDLHENSTKTGKQAEQYDLKRNKTMFPLHLIKPTVGMNLGKLEGGGAKVHVMDLGGATTMRPLWERYYDDVHGIAFVVDVSPASPMSKLMESRAFYRCMRDDESLAGLPILIFGNKVDERSCDGELGDGGDAAAAGAETGDCDGDGEFREGCGTAVEEAVSGGGTGPGLCTGVNSLTEVTELFLSAPRGSASRSSNYLEPSSNGLATEEEIGFFAGSAKTGIGVRVAFEWLIHEAKVIEKERRLRVE